MTVAGPVFLAILGMSLYLISNLTGKEVRLKNFAVIVPHLWMVGILIFSTGMMWGGLEGEPRRTNLGMSYLEPESPLYQVEWVWTTSLAVFGGLIMFASMAIYFVVLISTALGPVSSIKGLIFPKDEALHEEPHIKLLHNWTPWLILMLVIIALAYYPAFTDVFNYTGPGAPPYDPTNPVPLDLGK